MLNEIVLPCRQVELYLLCVGLLNLLRLLECAKLGWHFDFCMVKQFFNGKYLDAGKVLIPAWGMVKARADCLCSHISAWVLKRDKDTDSCVFPLERTFQVTDMT